MSYKVLISREQALYITDRCGLTLSDTQEAYRCHSPLRSGSDSNSFSLTIQRQGLEYTGAYKDHVSDEKGSLLDLYKALGGTSSKRGAERLSKPREASKPSMNSSSAGKGAQEPFSLATYAKAHGVGVEHFLSAGWSDAEYKGAPALRFSTTNGHRWRLSSGASKYVNEKGYKNCWYGLDKALAMRSSKPLIICNGEASTVVGHAYSMPTTCVTGGEKGKLPDNLLKELLEKYSPDGLKHTIIIAFDCDETGRKSAPALKAQLSGMGYDVKALDLGLALDGGDLADYLKLHTVERFYQLPELPTLEREAEPSEPSAESLLSGIQSMSSLDIQDIQAPTPIIATSDGGALLFSDRVYVVAGDAKLGKSTFCLHIAHCVATQAKAVLGSTDLYVEKDGRVLILDLEQELSDSVPRARAMGALSERLDVLDADTWESKLEEYSAQFDADTLVRMLITAWCARHNDRALVIVDNLSLIQPEFTFSKDRGLQEREWITKYKALAKKYGVAILLVEHNNKASAHDTGYTSSARVRGTAQKLGATNGGHFTLERTRGDMEQAKGEIRLSIEVRSAKKRTLYIKRDETLGHHTLSIALEGLSPSDYEKIRKETHKKVIDQLEQAVVAPKDIALTTGLARSTVQKALDELEQAGYVKKVKHGIYALNVQKLRPQEAEQRALVDTLDT